MQTVAQLQQLALKLSPDRFAEALGPFLLVHRPPEAIYAQMAAMMRSSSTVPMAHRRRLGEQILGMMQGFQQSWVLSVPGVAPGATLVIGRAEDCAIRIDEPSVSKQHAVLRWTGTDVTLRDLASSNGTFLNARAIADVEMPLGDGDAISFGDAQFLFTLPRTLHGQLLSAGMRP